MELRVDDACAPGIDGACVLRVDGLCVVRGARPLFHDVSLQLRARRVTLLRGANGSGKSTLLRALAGLVAIEHGTVSVDAATPTSPATRVLATHAVYAGHAVGIKPELSALENLRSMAGLDGLCGPHASDEALASALTECGLSRRTGIESRRLSQGQRQRIALARLALHVAVQAPTMRRVWLLDEPSAALDQDGDALLARLIRQHLQRGGCALVATHLPLDVPPDACNAMTLTRGTLLPEAFGQRQ